MMKIHRDGYHIHMDGHAGNKIACAMMTALSVAYINNLRDMAFYEGNCTLDVGVMDVMVPSDNSVAVFLTEAFWNAVNGLVQSYPNSFSIV